MALSTWEQIGNELKSAREQRGWSLRDVAKLCEARGVPITNAAISMIENGHQRPSVQSLEALCRVFGLTVGFGPDGVSLADTVGDQLRVFTAPADEMNTRAKAGRVLARQANERREDVRLAYARAFEMPIEEAQALADGSPKSAVAAAGLRPVAPTRAEQDYLAGRLGPVSADTAPGANNAPATRSREPRPRSSRSRSTRTSRGSPGRSTGEDDEADLDHARGGGLPSAGPEQAT